jgi:hypothetical protein
MAPQYIGAVGARMQDTYRFGILPGLENLYLVGE